MIATTTWKDLRDCAKRSSDGSVSSLQQLFFSSPPADRSALYAMPAGAEVLTLARRPRGGKTHLFPALDLGDAPFVHHDFDRAETHFTDETHERAENLLGQGARVGELFGCCKIHVVPRCGSNHATVMAQ